jgi:hypothetical protein
MLCGLLRNPLFVLLTQGQTHESLFERECTVVFPSRRCGGARRHL